MTCTSVTDRQAYTLTRYLYAKDECIIMFVSSLLSKKTKESYYWVCELYYSGYDICNLFWNIYYDFYFDFNPKLEIFIRKKFKKTITIETYFHIIQNLIQCKNSSRIFMMRQLIEGFTSNKLMHHKYNIRGRKPKYCNNIEKKYQNLIICIYKKDYEGIAHHIYQLLILEQCNEYELFANIINFYIENMCQNNYSGGVEQIKGIYSKFLNINKHKKIPNYVLFISVIVNFIDHIAGCVDKIMPICLFDKNDCESIYKHENTCEYKIYHTLPIKRLYRIDACIGSFNLSRNIFDDLHKDVLGKWEYYSQGTPCWDERFHHFKASFTCDCKIKFENDDLLEDFYDSYGYEPDEQSKKIQDQSIGVIDDVSWKIWYDLHFTGEPCVVFEPNFKFTY